MTSNRNLTGLAVADPFTVPAMHDNLAEMSVLGGMMLSDKVIADCADQVKAADFYRPAHQTIFQAIIDQSTSGMPVDAITVVGRLRTEGTLAHVGDATYVGECLDIVPVASNAPFYARIVAERAYARRMMEATTRSQQLLCGPGDATEVAARVEVELRLALDSAPARKDTAILNAEQVFGGWLDNYFEPSSKPISTGLMDLDQQLGGEKDADPEHGKGGWLPGQFILIGARPGVGMSIFGLSTAIDAALSSGLQVLVVNLEMGRWEIANRAIASVAKLKLDQIKNQSLSDADVKKALQTQQELAASGLHLVETGHMTPSVLRKHATGLRDKGGLDLIVVDYIQLMRADGRHSTDQARLEEISRELKLLAKDLAVPVVALVQLNRGSTKSNTPSLESLRGSGALEQDADVVIVLHRDDVIRKKSTRAGEMDLHVVKNREGRTGTTVALVALHYSRMTDPDELTRAQWEERRRVNVERMVDAQNARYAASAPTPSGYGD